MSARIRIRPTQHHPACYRDWSPSVDWIFPPDCHPDCLVPVVVRLDRLVAKLEAQLAERPKAPVP